MLDLAKSYIRDADIGLISIVWEWRNQKHIREMMFHREYIEWEEHVSWFHSMLVNNNKFLKIFYYNSLPMGVITFSSSENNPAIQEWGFYIGDKEAPKGMGTLLGICALDEYFSDETHIFLKAEVLEFNTKSLFFHKKLGFVNVNVEKESYEINDQKYSIYHFLIERNRWKRIRNQLIKNIKCR